jgi:pyruvate formate lyase activating enzyme
MFLPRANIAQDSEQTDDDSIGYIHSVETCGTVDGPGLRYVLFLSGCPLRCVYCHNPDAQGKPRGKTKTVRELLQDVLRYQSFIRDGGLTISGGEPLLQAEFVAALFAGAKRVGLHTALDTSGFRGDLAPSKLLDHTDLALLDIKSWERATYKRVTGVEIESTLAFARRLEQRGIPVWVRFVLVPGLTDDDANVEGIAGFAAKLTNVQRVQVLPFHKLAEHKYARLGIKFQLEATPTPTPAQITRAREIFAHHGVRAE